LHLLVCYFSNKLLSKKYIVRYLTNHFKNESRDFDDYYSGNLNIFVDEFN